jgi:hypothetical protein
MRVEFFLDNDSNPFNNEQNPCYRPIGEVLNLNPAQSSVRSQTIRMAAQG